jgi:hypothetical protein
MSEEEKEKKEEKKTERPLLCPEEWKDEEGRNVLGEYHKGDEKLEADLDAFEQYWKDKGAINFESEYHKEGAPYMEAPSEWDGHRARLGRVPDREAEEEARRGRESARRTSFGPEGEERPNLTEAAQQIGRAAVELGRKIDINALEVVTYAAFRAIFGYGIRVPIKKEGLVDLDIIVKGKDFVVNTNQLYFEIPELAVWRIVYSHKGRPVMELGRGVKNGFKLHRLNSIRLGFEIWWQGRKRRIAKQKQKAEATTE